MAEGEAGMGQGLALIRMTPRFNPDVNSYWMCDIGRFDYHWVEGDTRSGSDAAARRRARGSRVARRRAKAPRCGCKPPAPRIHIGPILVSAHAASKNFSSSSRSFRPAWSRGSERGHRIVDA
jgi:hypothetical protein